MNIKERLLLTRPSGPQAEKKTKSPSLRLEKGSLGLCPLPSFGSSKAQAAKPTRRASKGEGEG